VSARADDQQVGAVSLVEEHLRGLTHAQYSFDLDTGFLGVDRVDRRIQRRTRTVLEHGRSMAGPNPLIPP
jgi:hypothetical protein